jgi:ankyrin repeat protein
VTPRCTPLRKRRAGLALAAAAAATVVLFAAVVRLEPEEGDAGDGAEDYLFTAMTFAAVLSAIACFAMLAVNAVVWLGEPGLTPQFYLGADLITPVHVAAAFGQGGVIDALVALGADVDARDARLRTPLHYAALHGRAGACGTLLKLGASLSARDDEGLFPYEVGLRSGGVGVSATSAGADLLAALGRPSPVLLEAMLDSCGQGADAASRWQDVREIMQHSEVFLSNSAPCANARSVADFSATSYLHGATPLIVLAGSRAVARAMRGGGDAAMQWELVARDLVVEHGAKVDALNPFTGRTALHEALGRARNLSLAETLLDMGASGRRATFDGGRTPLHMAARAGFESVLGKIGRAENGMDLSDGSGARGGSRRVDPAWMDALDEEGSTALHDAVSRHHIGCVRALLEMGCDPSIPGGSGCAAISSMYTPLGWAVVQRPGFCADSDSSDEESEEDDEYGVGGAKSKSAPQKEPAGTTEALLRALLQSSAGNPNMYSPVGLAPLHLAARAQRTDAVRMLLEAGADPTLPCQRGRTPLQYAQANNGRSETACVLVEMLMAAEAAAAAAVAEEEEEGGGVGGRSKGGSVGGAQAAGTAAVAFSLDGSSGDGIRKRNV